MIALIPHDHGMGHFYRLKTIASRLKSRGVGAGFYLEQGLQRYGKKEKVLKDLQKADQAVIDTNDISFLRKNAGQLSGKRIIWITDLQDIKGQGLDAVIAPFAENNGKGVFRGYEYFVVSEPEVTVRFQRTQKVKNIGISFGSLDETNNLFYILYHLDKLGLLKEFNFNVLIGPRYPYRRFIDEYFKSRPIKALCFHEAKFKSIYDFLKLNDVMLTCCNNTAFEALFCGIPIINMVQNQVQYANAQRLEKLYGMPNLGFFPTGKEIAKVFRGRIFKNFAKSSQLARTIIDGQAAERITNIIQMKGVSNA